jgi:hypothetical protein
MHESLQRETYLVITCLKAYRVSYAGYVDAPLKALGGATLARNDEIALCGPRVYRWTRNQRLIGNTKHAVQMQHPARNDRRSCC